MTDAERDLRELRAIHYGGALPEDPRPVMPVMPAITGTIPPTEAELREWRSLRSLAYPGPGTLYTVYRIAFPVLLDEYARLQAEVERLTAEVRRLSNPTP